MSLAAFAFETYVTRSIPSWVTPQVFAMDVVGVVLGVTLIGLVMGLRLVEEEVVRSVVSGWIESEEPDEDITHD
jgi:hypothetical protein